MQSFALVSSQRTVAAVDTPAPFAVAAAVESLGSSSVRHWSHGGQEFNFARNRRLFQDANCNTKLEMTSHPGLDNANISRDLRDLLTIPSHSFASYWRSPLFLGERNQFIADASSLYATFNPEFNGLYSLDGSLLLPPGSGSIPSGLVFTRNDLDVVLYGYIKHQEGGRMIGHALSGLRFADLAYGIDRILGGCGSALHKSTIPRPDVNLHLPEGLELLEASFSGVIHYGVVCKQNVIAKGSRFGPFRGKLVNTSEIKTNDDNSHMWEIFEDGKLSHFVDGRGSASSCWLTYVNCARYAEEQNMVALQFDGQIYYEACKEIRPDSELLVWYGDDYLQFMGIPMSLKQNPFGSETTFGGESESGEGYQCDHCGKVFAYRYYRDKHLKYTRCVDQGDRKYPCHLCTRSFEKRDRLRIHVLHVHEKHQPHKCVVCGKSFSQSSSLNKHMRVHSGERPYKCVYCSKAFTASSILRTHIRQHSGEKPFKCKHCGKAFASHAAHDSHVRRTHAQLAAADGSTKRSQAAKVAAEVCGICGMTFQQQCELKFHLKLHNPAILDYCMLPPGSTLPEESATPPSPAPRPTATSRSQTQQQRERYLHAQQMDVQLKNHAWFQEKLKN